MNSWLDVAIVWYTDPKFVLFFNQGSNYGSLSKVTFELRMRMKLGVEYITRNTAGEAKNMIFDNLMIFDRPLSQREIDLIV